METSTFATDIWSINRFLQFIFDEDVSIGYIYCQFLLIRNLRSICVPAVPDLVDWFSIHVRPDWNELMVIRLLHGFIIWGDNEPLVWLRCDRGCSISIVQGRMPAPRSLGRYQCFIVLDPLVNIRLQMLTPRRDLSLKVIVGSTASSSVTADAQMLKNDS